jgi:hypothetical protein
MLGLLEMTILFAKNPKMGKGALKEREKEKTKAKNSGAESKEERIEEILN